MFINMEKVLCFFLLLAICYRVSSQEGCIFIHTVRTSKMVEGKPVFRCTVGNGCEDPAVCGIVLKCPGFEPIVPVESRLLAKGQHDKCLVYQGYAIGGLGQVAFHYALPSGGSYNFKFDGGNNCTFRYPPQSL